jgi:hypothetical protein
LIRVREDTRKTDGEEDDRNRCVDLELRGK